MVHRIGIDLVDVQGVADAAETFGARYLRRVYTDREIADCTSSGGVVPFRLAARFAAKEATMKVLARTDAVPWRAIEVLSHAGRPPALLLTGAAADRAASEGLSDFVVSLSHDGPVSGAVVLATEGS